VWHIPITADLITRVHDHHPLHQVVGKQSRQLPNRRRLPHPRPTEEQAAAAAQHKVAHKLRAAPHGAADATRKPHDLAGAVPHAADAVEGGVDAGTVVAAELPHLQVRENWHNAELRMQLGQGIRVLYQAACAQSNDVKLLRYLINIITAQV
jgi:hypothetical protein